MLLILMMGENIHAWKTLGIYLILIFGIFSKTYFEHMLYILLFSGQYLSLNSFIAFDRWFSLKVMTNVPSILPSKKKMSPLY